MRRAVLTAALFSWWMVACTPRLPVSAPHALLGQPLPVRSVDALSGRGVRLPEKGKVTLVDVWSTSCKPCLEAMPALERLHQQEQGAGLAVVGIAVDDSPGLVRDFVQKLGVSYPSVVGAGTEDLKQIRQAVRAVLAE